MEIRAKVRPLLCELHAHTTWSDGRHTIAELVDLYGRHGFDVLCITDHILPTDDPWRTDQEHAGVSVSVAESEWAEYLREIEQEAWRARIRYGLLVLPGAELTLNHEDPDLAAHAVAVGLRRYVGIDGEFTEALREARAAGAGLIAAHPHGDGPDPHPLRTTRRFWKERGRLAGLVDRFELFNRNTLFGWVAEARLSGVASGDFHCLDHLATWKTLLPCVKDERAVVAYLRSSRPAYLARLEDAPSRRAHAA